MLIQTNIETTEKKMHKYECIQYTIYVYSTHNSAYNQNVFVQYHTYLYVCV